MKWIKHIWFPTLIMIYLVCSARTCSEDEETAIASEEQHVKKLIESVETAFTTDTLADSLLRAYEITAIDKLHDFADYMKITSDTSIDLRFRKHAAESVRDMFVPGEIKLTSWSKYYPESGLNNLELLLEQSLSEGISCWIQPLKVDVRNPFTRTNDSTCTGVLSFIPDCIPFINYKHSVKVSDKAEIDIFIIKKLKYFGEKQLRVWEIYLGNAN